MEEHIVLEHEDIHATNTIENPNRVKPHSKGNARVKGGNLTAVLPKASWNVMRLRRPARSSGKGV